MQRFKQFPEGLLKRHKTAKVFALVALAFGLYFAYTVPPLWGTDETSHVARIYQLAQGHVHAEHFGDTRAQGGYGGHIPYDMYVLIVNVDRDLSDGGTYDTPYGTHNVDSRALYKQLANVPLQSKDTATYAFPNTAAYSPAAYGAQVGAMKLAMVWHKNLGTAILWMRLAGLFVFVAIAYFALRALDASRFKWLFFVVALWPMSVFEASIITADSITTAAVLLFVALIVKAVTKPAGKTLTATEGVVLLIDTVLLPLLKPGYVTFLPLLLFVPNVRLFARWVGWMLKAFALAAAAVGFMVWSKIADGPVRDEALIQPGNNWMQVNPNAQTHFMLSHPLSTAEVFVRSMLLESNQRMSEMLGWLGFNQVFVPGVAMIIEIVALFLAVALIGKTKRATLFAWMLVAASLASAFVIAAAEYITYTDVGAPLVKGIQGRYFVPVVAPLFVGLAILLRGRFTLGQNANEYRYLARTLCIAMVVCLLLSAIKYTYVTWG